MNKKIQWTLWAAGLALIIFYPHVFGAYYANFLVGIAIFALYASSFNLLLGYTGLLSFGHAMFFGTGAYGTALALTHIDGLPLIPAILIGIFSAMVLAICIAPIVVRVGGAAFAMVHLAFGQLMFMMALKLRHVTGGEDGIGGFPTPPLSVPGVFSLDMKDSTLFFYFAMAVIVGSLFLMRFLIKTPFGQVIVGIRDNANRINYAGFRVPHSKAFMYVVSAAFAGIAGSVYVLFQNLISAYDAYHIMVHFMPVIMVMVGGVGTFIGPVLGAVIFGVLEEVVTYYTHNVGVVYGVILIFVIIYMPLGLAGFLNTIRMRLSAIWMKSADKSSA